MENDEQLEPSKIYPRTISFEPIDYTDRLVKGIRDEIESKCSVWKLELTNAKSDILALRREWQLEHTNLIQRLENERQNKQVEKNEVDKHFERINELQTRMDKLSMTFQTNEQVNSKIEVALAGQTKYFAILIIIIISALSIIVFLLEREWHI
jgi:hypothetical protein